MTTTFQSFLSDLGIKTPPAFSLDFSIVPRNFKDITTKEVSFAGFSIPLIKSLLVREKVLIEAFTTSVVEKKNEFQLELEKVAYKLNTDLGLGSLILSRGLLAGVDMIDKSLTYTVKKEKKNTYEAAIEIQQSEAYTTWLSENQELIQKVANTFAEAYGESQSVAVIATIFLISRTNGNWSYSDTFTLTDSELQTVYSLYEDEAGINKDEEVKVEAEPDVVDNLGKD